MTKFVYNNAKNASTSHIFFELNWVYHLYVSFEENINLCSQSKTADELSIGLQEVITVCLKNLHHAQKLQKQAHNKYIKPRSYALDNKVWLNSKYIKTKQNRKLEAKFFEPFRVLYSISKQAYKLELPKRLRIHHVFQVSLLGKNTIRRRRVDKKVTELEFKAGNSNK